MVSLLPFDESLLTPFVIPFFIAHEGCPHQCVFCNQHSISGASVQAITPQQVAAEINEKLAWPRLEDRPVQVAFYGGSFTGLLLRRQEELLGAVAPFLAGHRVQEIRVSTRPDFINHDVVDQLKAYGVGLVELGVQSLDEHVLQVSGRGHTCLDVKRAFAVLQDQGLRVGGQLMVGLPGDSRLKALKSAQKLAGLQPDLVRLYPTLVMKGSPLAASFIQGEYRPWSLDLCSVVCAAMKDVFDKQGIVVARMGLQSGESLEKDMLAGPYHPAFGELVLSRQFFKKVRKRIVAAKRKSDQGSFTLQLAERDRSLFTGLSRANMARYQKNNLLDNVKIVFRPDQPRFTMEVV